MGTNSLNSAIDGEVIPASDINQFKTAMNGDIIPRNTSGIAEADAGDLGSSTYPYKDLHISGDINLSGGKFIPVGSYMDYIFSTAPQGWLLANGDTIGNVGSGATHESANYEALFLGCVNDFGNAGTEVFASGDTVLLPDLRGYFRRGWDNGRGIDSGRAINTVQADQNQNHNHGGGDHTHSLQWQGSSSGSSTVAIIDGDPFAGTTGQTDQASPPWNVANSYVRNNTSGTTITADGGTEVRTKNISANVIIKY